MTCAAYWLFTCSATDSLKDARRSSSLIEAIYDEMVFSSMPVSPLIALMIDCSMSARVIGSTMASTCAFRMSSDGMEMIFT